jgi:uncharacterized protein YndB with AHSA1/START domain
MEGYLVISDITGYTAYLTGTEQHHAEEILHDLFISLLEHTVSPLVVSKLEGDAILSYAPKDGFIEGQALFEVIENLYVQFRQSRQNMHRHTSCECDACRNIPNLDLKFFVHYGTYSLMNIGGYEELSGPNVILIHRLLKNKVTTAAYTIYTSATAEALLMTEYCATQMQAHSEEYEHLGEVPTYVQDMHLVWEQYQARNRIFLGENDLLFHDPVEIKILAPLSAVWEYLIQPKTFPLWQAEVDSARVTNMNKGRTGVGTTGHCAHGKQVFTTKIVDLRAFDYITYETLVQIPLGEIILLFTYQLTEIEEGTHLVLRASVPRTNSAFWNLAPMIWFSKNVMNPYYRKREHPLRLETITRLRNLIEQEIATGNITPIKAAKISDDEINTAVKDYVRQQSDN